MPPPEQARPREPEFRPQEPANTTVKVGEAAVLQCSGTSEVTPHIKVRTYSFFWNHKKESLGIVEKQYIPRIPCVVQEVTKKIVGWGSIPPT